MTSNISIDDQYLNYRLNFSKGRQATDTVSIVANHIQNYRDFLQVDADPDKREDNGLEAILRSEFPVTGNSGMYEIVYKKYYLIKPTYSPRECIDTSASYTMGLRCVFSLNIYENIDDEKVLSVSNEQDVYVFDVPAITDSGVFIIGGIEKVIISQIHRSPGLLFYKLNDASSVASGSVAARVFPVRGVWLDFEFDYSDSLYIKFDKRKKIPIDIILYSLYKDPKYLDGNFDEFDAGHSASELLNLLYKVSNVELLENGLWHLNIDRAGYVGDSFAFDILDKAGKAVLKAGDTLSNGIVKKYNKSEFYIDVNSIVGSYIAKDHSESMQICHAITEADLKKIKVGEKLSVLISSSKFDSLFVTSIGQSKTNSREKALVEFYRLFTGFEAKNIKDADTFMYNMLFSDKYKLSITGRSKMNSKLGVNCEGLSLYQEDLIGICKYILKLRGGEGSYDDLDSLSNRRIRPISEAFENVIRAGLAKACKFSGSRYPLNKCKMRTPGDLLNFKFLSSAVREFFYSSALCQFMDQTNVLTGLSHKRRISALGPGGVNKERAGFEIRDVHITHYGRICPIETPEGQNVGLINSFAVSAKVNELGFIESPYFVVKDGRITDEIKYLPSELDGDYIIAGFCRDVDDDYNLIPEKLTCRYKGEYHIFNKEDVQLIDASSSQMVSFAASLIPFLEHNDANRALMGSNMQRQAVPLLNTDAPIVGTGMEGVVNIGAGELLVSDVDGVVSFVDSTRIVIIVSDDNDKATDVKTFYLKKFVKSNQSTCINQRPAVQVGDKVKKGDLLIIGSSADIGDLALGRNVLCAFMPWYGFNFEDSMVLSERLISEGIFDSIHIEEFSVSALDMRIGPEEITRDVPNADVSKLDEQGIICVGSVVRPGDILVGKVTPKCNPDASIIAEERLLRAIFGDKASGVKDTSLRAPQGVTGVVFNIVVSLRQDYQEVISSMAHQREVVALRDELAADIKILTNNFRNLIATSFKGKECKDGGEISKEYVNGISDLSSIKLKKSSKDFDALLKNYADKIQDLKKKVETRIEILENGVPLPPEVLQVVRVFVASKRSLQSGDKLAGRHGNKGVISKIVPVEDMPHMEDGTPIDIILNPLGVPSRMNIGQVFELHLGMACVQCTKFIKEYIAENGPNAKTREVIQERILSVVGPKKNGDFFYKMTEKQFFDWCDYVIEHGLRVATPVFDGATASDIDNFCETFDIKTEMPLIDGMTGEYFDKSITVGYKYILKLDHLVDDKAHARSVGSYSLVENQPLGGRSQSGGQRSGLMENWAYEAYGAAFSLLEMVTIKSDDIRGRAEAFDSIARGGYAFTSYAPESFNVLYKELHALGITVECIKDDDYYSL